VTLKVPSQLKSLDASTVPSVNKNFERSFQVKVESIHSYQQSSTAHVPFLYQSMEHGENTYSATGSATITKTFSLKEKQNKIIFVKAHALSTQVSAHVTDITQTAVTIECRTISGTALFSSVTTASVKVFWEVIGSNP